MAKPRTSRATKSTSSRKVAPKKLVAEEKKTPVSPARKSSVTPKEQPIETTTPAQKKEGMKFRKSYLIIALAVVLLAALFYLFRGVFFVASVNGQLVSKAAFYAELEQQAGKQAYNSLITKRLIEQEAAKRHVSVTTAETNAELKKIEDNLAKQGQKLDTVLNAQGMSKDSLMEQIRLQKLVEKMVGQDVTVSDKEVSDYLAQNKSSLPQGQDENAMKASAKDTIKQQKLNTKIQTWLADIRNKAKIDAYVKY